MFGLSIEPGEGAAVATPSTGPTLGGEPGLNAGHAGAALLAVAHRLGCRRDMAHGLSDALTPAAVGNTQPNRLLGVLLVAVVFALLAGPVMGIDPSILPTWAR